MAAAEFVMHGLRKCWELAKVGNWPEAVMRAQPTLCAY